MIVVHVQETTAYIWDIGIYCRRRPMTDFKRHFKVVRMIS